MDFKISDLERMSTKKQKAYHKAKRTNSDVDWDAYRTLNNQFTYAKKRAYNSHWEPNLPKMTILRVSGLLCEPNVLNLTPYLL